MRTDLQQHKNNQVAYKAKGWPTYPQGAYNTHRDSTTSPPITDWVPGQEPAWAPIAGGKGFGNPQGTGVGKPPDDECTTPTIQSSLDERDTPPKPGFACLVPSSAVLPKTPTQPPAEKQTQQSEQQIVATPATASTPAPVVSIAEVQTTSEIQVQEYPETSSIPPGSNAAPVVSSQSVYITAPSGKSSFFLKWPATLLI